MSQQELLTRLAFALEDAGVAYMLTGSWASSIYGEPRATHDVDLVVDTDRSAVDAIRRAFPADEYAFDEVAATNAIRSGGMFQLWRFASGDSADLWVRGDDVFSTSALSRRRRHRIGELDVYICSPEDLIIQKLRWAELSGGSEKQMNDVRGVYELQFKILDLVYIEQWITQLGLGRLWERIRSESKPL